MNCSGEKFKLTDQDQTVSEDKSAQQNSLLWQKEEV